MNSPALEKFNSEIVAEAIKLVDKDKIARLLADTIEKNFIESAKEVSRNLDLSSWIEDELTSSNSPAGKLLDKAVSEVAKRMAIAIKG